MTRGTAAQGLCVDDLGARLGLVALMDEKRQREHLARANRHIVQLRNRISHQLQIVELLRRKGRPREEAEETLTILEDGLRTLERHRELILEGLQKTKK